MVQLESHSPRSLPHAVRAPLAFIPHAIPLTSSPSRITTTIIAPTPLIAANFVILGRIIKRLGQQYSRLSAMWCASLSPRARCLSSAIYASTDRLARPRHHHLLLMRTPPDVHPCRLRTLTLITGHHRTYRASNRWRKGFHRGAEQPGPEPRMFRSPLSHPARLTDIFSHSPGRTHYARRYRFPAWCVFLRLPHFPSHIG